MVIHEQGETVFGLTLGSLRLRLIGLVFLAVIPAFWLTLYSGLEQRRLAVRTAKMHALELARNASKYHRELIENAHRTLFVLSQMPPLSQTMNQAVCVDTFAALLSKTEGYNALALVDAKGDIVVSTPEVPRPVNIADRPYYQRLVQSRDFVIGEYQISRISGKPSIILGYPVLDDASYVKAVLISELDLAWLNLVIGHSKLPEDATISIVDRKGTILARYPRSEEYVGKILADISPVEVALASGEGVAEGIGIDGIARLYGVSSLGNGSEALYVRVGISKEMAYAEANHYMMRNLSLLGLAALLSLMLTWFVGERYVLRWIEALLRVTKDVTKGDLSAHVGPAYADGQLGELARAFDQMTEALKRRELERDAAQRELQRAQEDLETRVQERTRALEEINTRLELEIQDRRRAEESLRESEARLANAQRIARLGHWNWDIPNNELTWSDEIYRIFGLAPREFGATFDAFLKRVHPSDRDSVKKAVDAALHKAESYCIDHRIIRPDGTERIVHEQAEAAFDASGRPVRMTGTVQDITERKRTEEERMRLEAKLRQAQKMEAIGTLAGGIAHDFNNILGVMLGFSQLALLTVPAGNRARGHLKDILSAGERAKELVRQILAFSRQNESVCKPIQINHTIKEVLKMLRSSLPTTIDVRQKIVSTGMVVSDPTQINQVLLNLCTNASHAMREKGGVLNVTLLDVLLDDQVVSRHPELKPGPYVELTVSDTGHGMDSEVLERIFDPYFTTKGHGEGTGLGLAVVHGIVKSHGGIVNVYSEPGKGTDFHVFFPRVMAETAGSVEEAEDGAADPLPMGSESILFVDDEEGLRKAGREMLELLGYDVTVMDSGVEALKTFKKQPDRFDLVITDLTMPKMTGLELSQELTRIRSGVPIVICTGFNQSLMQEKLERFGIREVISKPILMDHFARTIRRVLDKIDEDNREEN